jgi:hypothetical protein
VWGTHLQDPLQASEEDLGGARLLELAEDRVILAEDHLRVHVPLGGDAGLPREQPVKLLVPARKDGETRETARPVFPHVGDDPVERRSEAGEEAARCR